MEYFFESFDVYVLRLIQNSLRQQKTPAHAKLTVAETARAEPATF